MDAVQMRNLMEHYGKLKAGLDACKGNIRRIKSSTFEEYVEEKTYRSTLGESRLNNSGPSNPTEMLGMYGRQQFEQERDFELRCEQRRMAGIPYPKGKGGSHHDSEHPPREPKGNGQGDL